MINKTYWEDIVNKLLDKNESNWAAHVITEYHGGFEEIVAAVGKEKLITFL